MTWRPGHACIEQEIKILRHGETVNLTALYETYSDLPLRTTLAYVSRSEDAQNVIHDVFAVYLAKRPTSQDVSHQRAWILCVTISKCRDLRRRNAVCRCTPLEDAEHIVSPEGPKTSELLAAVQSLPGRLHEVVVLHYLEGSSMEEAAHCPRISVSAAKMRLTRGRQAIKALPGMEE